MESPFDVLRLDPDADDEEIDAAYRRRVKETHPDQGGTAEEFQLVTAAYEQITSGDRTAPLDIERDDGDDEDEPPDPRVEYLDFEVLEERGWSLDDDDLFEKAADANLDRADHGTVEVGPGQSLLEAAESDGLTWPYSCRGGACANCAVAVTEGELTMSVNHVLPPEMTDRNIGLSCIGSPTTDSLQVVYNVKHLPDLDELRLPPGPFEHAQATD